MADDPESSSLELKRVLEAYNYQQAKSVRYAALTASIGVSAALGAILAGFAFAWSYYNDAIRTVQDARMAVLEENKRIDELFTGLQSLNRATSSSESNLQALKEEIIALRRSIDYLASVRSDGIPIRTLPGAGEKKYCPQGSVVVSIAVGSDGKIDFECGPLTPRTPR